MFRIVTKRLPATITRGKSIFETQFQTRHQSQGPKRVHDTPSGGVGSKIWVTVGAITLIGGGVTYYAKENDKFKGWIVDHVPGTEDYFKFVFQEEKTYFEHVLVLLELLKLRILGLFTSESPRPIQDVKSQPKGYTAPGSAFGTLAQDTKIQEQPYTEIRIDEKGQGDDDHTITIGGDKRTPVQLSEQHPASLAALEQQIRQLTENTMRAFNSATLAAKSYSKNVEVIIDTSVDRLDEHVWKTLKEKNADKVKSHQEAKKFEGELNKLLAKFRAALDKCSKDVEECVRKEAQENIAKIEKDLQRVRKELDTAAENTLILDKYWDKVEKARLHFKNELSTLFPNVDLEQKKLQIDLNELDLFIMHTFSTVMYWQKELFKMQTLLEKQISNAIESAKKGNPELLIDAKVLEEVEKCRRHVMEDFRLKCLELRNESEKELRAQLKLQSETFQDHLNEAIKVRETELEREFNRKADEKMSALRDEYKMELSKLVGRVLGMDQALKARIEKEKIAEKSQILWSASHSLYTTLRTSFVANETVRPLGAEVENIRRAAYEKDSLVNTVLDTIPKEAVDRGVLGEHALRERFLNVDKTARRLALVPSEGARLPLYLLSYVQSMLLIQGADTIPAAELNNEVVDFSKLETNEILDRARYWVDRADLAQALKYMNLLKGAARNVAHDWMNETRIYLETMQAAEVLMAHASANGLKFL